MTRIAVIKETACHLEIAGDCQLAKIYFLLRALVQMPPLLGRHSLEGIPLSLPGLCCMVSLDFIIFIPQINYTSSLTCNTESKDPVLFTVIKVN